MASRGIDCILLGKLGDGTTAYFPGGGGVQEDNCCQTETQVTDHHFFIDDIPLASHIKCCLG